MLDVVHCWHINRGAAANVERLRFREEIRELVFPRRLEINCICQNKTCCCAHSVWRNQIANPIARLVGGPSVNLLSRSIRISFEIEWLERRAVEFFHQLTKWIEKI